MKIKKVRKFTRAIYNLILLAVYVETIKLSKSFPGAPISGIKEKIIVTNKTNPIKINGK